MQRMTASFQWRRCFSHWICYGILPKSEKLKFDQKFNSTQPKQFTRFEPVQVVWAICKNLVLGLKGSFAPSSAAVQFQQDAETLYCQLPFCMALSWSAHWQSSFILLHSLTFFFLGFCLWWSHTDRVLTLNINTWLPLFWKFGALGVGPGARTLPMCHMCWPLAELAVV